ncbi:MAG: radical SAM protein, partial [Bacteroidaceae bacterium]|nr:radical SAM protein [Bacteroidaceae bacterium]
IHICVDTNGSIWNDDVKELLSLADLILLDVKQYNPERHRVLTERSNEQTLRTAEWLESIGKPFWLRYVLVQGYSAIEEDIRALCTHFSPYKMLQRVEILPYHTLGVHKYEAMGKEYKLAGVKENTPAQLDEAKAIFDEYFPKVYIN